MARFLAMSAACPARYLRASVGAGVGSGAGGGGVAVGAGAVSAVSSGLGRERTSAANGLAEVEARCFDALLRRGVRSSVGLLPLSLHALKPRLRRRLGRLYRAYRREFLGVESLLVP